MTASKAFEIRIIRQLMNRRARESAGGHTGGPLLAERIIAVLAATAGLFLIGSVLQELLWALLAAGTVLTLGSRT
tara:strand:+ start:10793 stop:11017 length:225 start_codon:yes stop_codon:yes gene_type:complete